MNFCKAQQEFLEALLEAVFYGGIKGGSMSQIEIKRQLGKDLHEAASQEYAGKYKENR